MFGLGLTLVDGLKRRGQCEAAVAGRFESSRLPLPMFEFMLARTVDRRWPRRRWYRRWQTSRRKMMKRRCLTWIPVVGPAKELQVGDAVDRCRTRLA